MGHESMFARVDGAFAKDSKMLPLGNDKTAAVAILWRRDTMLQGKKVGVFNVANRRSLAWAIATAMNQQGAHIALGYQNERTGEEAASLAAELSPPALLMMCDVLSEESMEAAFAVMEREWGTLDVLVHSLAFAPKDALENPFVETSREAFQMALEISAYSLVALTRRALPLMSQDANIVTLTYFGAEKVIPSYNVMGVAKASLEASVRYLAHDLGGRGIRVNAISAGPVSTLASRGIPGFVDMLRQHRERAPLGRNVDQQDVAAAAVFLASSMAQGITGEVLHVDAGYNIMGF